METKKDTTAYDVGKQKVYDAIENKGNIAMSDVDLILDVFINAMAEQGFYLRSRQ